MKNGSFIFMQVSFSHAKQLDSFAFDILKLYIYFEKKAVYFSQAFFAKKNL